jgi:hypothetical protein
MSMNAMDDRNIPYGCERVAYDADTETYTYLDTNTGRYYTTTSGMRYLDPDIPCTKTKRKALIKICKNETISSLKAAFNDATLWLSKALNKHEEKKKRRRLTRQRALEARWRAVDEAYYV